MRKIKTFIGDLGYLFRCLKATWIMVQGKKCVYAVMVDGQIKYQYVTDFKNFQGIPILGVMGKDERHFVDGIVRLDRPVKVTKLFSVHALSDML